MEKTINGENNKYLGQFMSELPENVMLNKVTTGCGATTLALESKFPYVVAVPFRAMIENKLTWGAINNVNVCPVWPETSDEYIKNFKGDKFLTTYDSLHRLNSLIDTSKYKIAVDECHKIIDAGSFRGPAIETVLENYQRYQSFVFMTATPIPDEYQHKELTHIPKVRVKWDNLLPVTVEYQRIPKAIEKAMAVIALKHLEDKNFGNAHIFINSVDLIIKTIKILKENKLFDADKVNIICAKDKDNQNLNKIQYALGKKYSIKSVGEVSKINFYTSTAFEGSDIFDENGKTYIATDGSRDHTKNDILVTLPQIIGRIRDTVYKNRVTVIYTKSNYNNGLTEEEFKQSIEKGLKGAESLVSDFNIVGKETQNTIIEGAQKNPYVIERNGVLKVNHTAKQNELYSFRTLHQTYYVREGDKPIKREIVNNTLTYNWIPDSKDVDFKGINKLKLNGTPNFIEVCKEYCENDNLTDSERSAILVQYPVISEAINLIGREKMKALRYRRKDIEEELIRQNKTASLQLKVVKLLNLKTGMWISADEAKERLQEIYTSLGITQKATATHLKTWYDLKPKKIWNSDLKKAVRGYLIITCKYNIKTYSKDISFGVDINTSEGF